MSKPILIAGAGPVGLTLACELLRHGCPVRIVDRNSQPTDKSKALVLWPRTLELLEKAGMARRFVEAGLPLHGMSIFENLSKRLAHIPFDDLRSPFPYVLGIPQNSTERLLIERLGELGVEVERQVEVVKVEQQKDFVEVSLRHPDGRSEVAHTAWLPACDGSHSTVRHQLGVHLEGESVAQEFAMIDCDVAGLPLDDEVVAFASPLGVAAFFPIAPPRMRVILLRSQCGAESTPANPTLEEMQQELARRGLAQVRLSEPQWLTAFRINERHAKNYRHGRVLLAGDAAHVHSPVGGQGMNTGMQDAINLAWKLALIENKKVVSDLLLDSYSLERQPVGAAVVQQTGRARQIITLRHPVATGVRNKMMSWLTSFEFVRHKISEEAAELTIKYPDSPLNREIHQGHAAWLLGQGIHPGDRAPDGIVMKDQSTRRLFELMQDSRFHLLLLSGASHKPHWDALDCARYAGQLAEFMGVHWIGHQADELPDLPSAWHDKSGSIHKEFGATDPTLYLIRPDGYVAFRCQPTSRQDLETYLREMGLPYQQDTP